MTYKLFCKSNFHKQNQFEVESFIVETSKLSEIKKLVYNYAKRARADNKEIALTDDFSAKEVKSKAHFAKGVLTVIIRKNDEILASHVYMVKWYPKRKEL